MEKHNNLPSWINPEGSRIPAVARRPKQESGVQQITPESLPMSIEVPPNDRYSVPDVARINEADIESRRRIIEDLSRQISTPSYSPSEPSTAELYTSHYTEKKKSSSKVYAILSGMTNSFSKELHRELRYLRGLFRRK
jgi:hypothetical protein